jgi:hypothetical protein
MSVAKQPELHQTSDFPYASIHVTHGKDLCHAPLQPCQASKDRRPSSDLIGNIVACFNQETMDTTNRDGDDTMTHHVEW